MSTRSSSSSRPRARAIALPFVLALTAPLAACAVPTDGAPEGASETSPFSSPNATLMAFDFDGELNAASGASATGAIRAQLLYLVGNLNAVGGVARLDKAAVTGVTTAAAGGGLTRVRYHASVPVAYGAKSGLPSSFGLTLPRRMDGAGQASFLAEYAGTCNEGEGAEITSSNFWYHFRPEAEGCSLAPADAVSVTARTTVAPGNTTGKYPELHRVWEDRSFNVLAVFAKYDVAGTTEDDAGIAAYDSFVAAVHAELPDAMTTPASLPAGPGVAAPDVTFTTLLDDGRAVNVTALLVNSVPSAGSKFIARYNELSPGADLVVYAGHAGLGANVRSLATLGHFFPGKYQVFFLDGCDTYAYMDAATTIAKARAVVNPDDAAGTKYMDVVTNAMPAYFASMPSAAMAVLRGLLHDEAPRTYEQILGAVDPSQIAVVTGEEDNVYTPGLAPGASYAGFVASGAVTKSQMVPYQTGVLAAGTYVFDLTSDATHPGGDADLRVRAGAAPGTTLTYKCPSYLKNTNEQCTLTLAAPQNVFVTVTGDTTAQASSYVLRAWKK